MKMSKYEQCLIFIKSRKAQKMKLCLGSKAVLLAIAKESDRLQQESVEISDERMDELATEEMLLLCIDKCKKLFKLIGDEEASSDKMYCFINHFCTDMDKDLEFLYKEVNKMIKLLKPYSLVKRKEILQQARMFIN